MPIHPPFVSALATCLVNARNEVDSLAESSATLSAEERADLVAQAHVTQAIAESLKLTIGNAFSQVTHPNDQRSEGLSLKVDRDANAVLIFKGLPLPVSLANGPARVMDALVAFMPRDVVIQLTREFLACLDIRHVLEEALMNVAHHSNELRYASSLLADAWLTAEEMLDDASSGSKESGGHHGVA